MSKVSNLLKDWTMAEIMADLVDPAKEPALDWIRYLVIWGKKSEKFLHDRNIPKKRAIPLRTLRKICNSESILGYPVISVEMDISGQMIIYLLD